MAIAATTLAQRGDDGFSFFVRGGLNFSQVGGDGLAGFDKLNLAAGLGVERAINEKFDWQLEINLLQKGSRKAAESDNGNNPNAYKMALLYAQVPLLFEYKHNESISILGGPGLGFLLASEETDFFGEIQNAPEFNTLDISFILAAKYNLSDRFGAEIRLDQSLIPIRSRGAQDLARLVGAQYNTVLGVLLSYSIN